MEENDGYYPCPMCRADLHWEDCESCCDGYTHHDCGDDTCCCLYPQDNVECDVCSGESGWWRCFEKKCGCWNTDELMEAGT